MTSAALPAPAVALVAGSLLAGALVAFMAATGARPLPAWRRPAPSRAAHGARRSGTRGVAAVVVGFAVLLATGWIVLAAAAAGLVLGWGRLLRDRRADDERARVEGIAKWLEDLRDTLRGSSMGIEEALEQVATRPPSSLALPLAHYLHRRRQGFATDDALADLADDLAHPTADAAIAAMLLVTGGSAGAGRLHDTVQALAGAARDEVIARERVDRTRAVYQSSMQRLVIIAALLVAYLRVAGGDLLDPYATPAGQIAMLLPLGMWLGCILWLRSLCGYGEPARRRVAARRHEEAAT